MWLTYAGESKAARAAAAARTSSRSCATAARTATLQPSRMPERRLRGHDGAAVLLRSRAPAALQRSRDRRCAHRGIAAKAVEGSGLPRRAQHRLGGTARRRDGGVACADAARARRPVAVHGRDVRGRCRGLELAEAGVAADPRALREPWLAAVGAVIAEATLGMPTANGCRERGRGGGSRASTRSTSGHLLAEMQHLQRAYPVPMVVGTPTLAADAASLPEGVQSEARGGRASDVVWVGRTRPPYRIRRSRSVSIVELGIVRDVSVVDRRVGRRHADVLGLSRHGDDRRHDSRALAVIGVTDAVLVNALTAMDHRLDVPEARTGSPTTVAPPRHVGRGRDQSHAQRRRPVSAVRVECHVAALAVRLDRVQGAVSVRRLSRAVRLLQAALTACPVPFAADRAGRSRDA